MAIETTPNIVKFRKAPDSAAVRAKRYRENKKRRETEVLPPLLASPTDPSPTKGVTADTATSRSAASILLTGVALTLAGVGITMNGWFARSLGATDIAGWLFLALGIASDAAALVIPAQAAVLWSTGQRVTAVTSWAIWTATFAFAVTASIGFASTNISDVTMARASRVTPAVTAATAALADVTAARDRECRGGVGKFCREREAAVLDARKALDAASKAVAAEADPQTEAATKIVVWLSAGVLHPTGADFAMLRLFLLALLPQIGGLVMMIGRAK